MEDTFALVLDDTASLAGLCGSNDENLKEIERLIGHPVHCRGNELFVDSDDQAGRELFSRIVRELSRQVAEGQRAGPELVRAIFESIGEEGRTGVSGSFDDLCIQIPGGFTRVFPKTAMQARYIAGMAGSDIAFGIGPAGTGKTFLAVAYALREVLSHRKRKLILTRPVVEAGESLGFLPGDLVQKINPYLRPLYDAMESLVPFEVLRRMEENRLIELAPLAYMRGRSLNSAVVVLDEAQNTTREQMKMFLTRLGDSSKAIITGDDSQIDLPRKAESGLLEAPRVLGGIPGISITRLEGRDVVRNPLIRKIIEAYDEKTS